MALDTIHVSGYASDIIGGVLMGAVTKFDPKQVSKLYAQGKSTIEIAEEMEGTPAGIRQVLVRAGVPLRSRSKAAEGRTKEAFGFLPTKGWLKTEMKKHEGNAMACAEAHGINYQTFVDHLRKNGISRLAPEDRRNVGAPRVEIPIEEAVELSSKGTTYSELAEKYDVTYGVIMRRMKEAGHSAPRDKMRRYEGKKTLPTYKRRMFEDLKADRGSHCQACKEHRHLDMAHIYENRTGGPFEKDNLLLLCPTHHRAFDRGTLTYDEFRFIKSWVRAAEKKYGFINNFYGDW